MRRDTVERSGRIFTRRVSASAPHNASVIGDPAEVRGKNICQTTGKGKTGGGERYQQHKQHKPTTIARATTQHALEGFTCGRNRKARLVAGNNVSEVRGERLEVRG